MSPSLALAAYAETWISGAKVIVFGDSLSPLAERLVERGARLVQVYDRDAARAAEATALEHSRQISYAPLDSAGSVARDGVFDFGIVEDLAAADRTAGPLPVLRKALGRRGMALIAARNPEVSRCLIPMPTEAGEPLGYYDLYEHVSAHFDEVRMLGQTAFVGYAVADFGAAEDADVRLDTAFLPGGAEEPEWFLALVSTLPVSSEAFSVIQIPLADVPSPAADRAEVESLEQALERAENRIAELEKAKAQRDAVRQAREPEQKAQLEALQAELAKREQWLAALEARAATADQRADDMQTELDQLAARNAHSTRELASLNSQSTRDLAAQSAQATRDLAAQNTQASRELAALNAQNTQASRELAALNAQNAQASRELAALNAQHAQASRELAALRTQSTQSTKELAEVSARATRERERLEQRLAEETSAKQALEENRTSLQRELELRTKSEVTAARATAELERRSSALSKNVERLEAELRTAEARLRQASEVVKEEPDAELGQLEAMLVERGAEVSRLSLALEQTERFGRQLIAELGLLKAAAANGTTASPELERLARRNAELEADLEAARWTISSLGANGVASGGTPPAARRDDGLPTARRSAD